MVSPSVSETVTVRNVFIIDDKQIIRAILVYPLAVGRNISEIYRLAIALQTTDKEKAAAPANWIPGQPLIEPAPKTYEELVKRVENPEGLDCISWYLCYRK
ncbi:Peroxiredoxin [bioreactor metagenome]|uniref:Peroxiredoxin n=1 Tax=bioreactor metagenome TaxID=1076179 RepID=A0A645HMZ6_9ZZZZ